MVASLNAELEKNYFHKEIARKYIAHSELEYNVVKDVQYLKDDCLHFRLCLHVHVNIFS